MSLAVSFFSHTSTPRPRAMNIAQSAVRPTANAMKSQTDTTQSDSRAKAESLMAEAGSLFQKGDAESRGEAFKKLEAALAIWRANGDRAGEAITLLIIGKGYDGLGEKNKALDFYVQALPLTRAVRDRGGEATTLNNIGAVYDALGEKQKALDFYVQALPLTRAVRDRGVGRMKLDSRRARERWMR